MMKLKLNIKKMKRKPPSVQGPSATDWVELLTNSNAPSNDHWSTHEFIL